MPGKIRLRKWSATEDRQLINSVNEYLTLGTSPDYRLIAKKIQQRSPKQCRERYENSLQPDVKRGEWSFDETLGLAKLMIVHGQNWAAVKDQLRSRTYNAIKKKGRKLLGEIVDRNSIPKGTTSKARSNWSEQEFRKLLSIHLSDDTPDDKKNCYLFLALSLKSGRSEAEVERKLVQKCSCSHCTSIKTSIFGFVGDEEDCLSDIAGFKEKWSLWKAAQVVKKLEESHLEKPRFKSTRRASMMSTASDSTMASSGSKRIKLEEDSHSYSSHMSDEAFFPFEANSLLPTTEIAFNLFPATTTSVTENGYTWPNPIMPRITETKQMHHEIFADEFDLSFLLPI